MNKFKKTVTELMSAVYTHYKNSKCNVKFMSLFKPTYNVFEII